MAFFHDFFLNLSISRRHDLHVTNQSVAFLPLHMKVNRYFIHFSIYDEMLLNFFPSFLWHFLILFLFSFHCFRMAMFSTNICVGKEIEAREKNETAATVNKCVNRINLHLLYFHYVQAQNARPIQATDDNFYTNFNISTHSAPHKCISTDDFLKYAHN